MPLITQTQGGQSSAAVNGQSIDYIAQQIIAQTSAPDGVVRMALQNCIREFYQKSTGWREVIGPYTLRAGVNRIQLNPVDQYSQCHFVLDAFVFPNLNGGNSAQWLRPLLRKPPSNADTQTAQPYTYFMEGPDVMLLYPNADRAYGSVLYVYMALMPVINVGRLPNFAITHHFDGLFYGTLERLCTMPNKPWTVKDTSLTMEWRRRFKQQVALARDITERGWGTADAPNWYPNFAGRYSQAPAAAAGRAYY